MLRHYFSRNKLLFYICCAAFILRVISIFIFVDLNDPEFYEYGVITRNLLSGLGYYHMGNILMVPSAYMPPGLPYIYYFMFSVFGDNANGYIAFFVFNSILAVISILVIYKVSMILFENRTVSLITAIYTAFSPVLIYCTTSTNPVIIYHLFIALAYMIFLKMQKIKPFYNKDILKYSIWFGIVIGLFLYFRAEATAFLVLSTVYFLFKKKIKAATIIFAAGVLIISPWTIRNYIVFHEFIPVSTTMGLNFYIGHSDIETTNSFNRKILDVKDDVQFESNRSALGIKESLAFISAKPWEEVKELFKKLYSLWVIDVYKEKAGHPIYIFTWLSTLLLFLYGYYKTWKDKAKKYSLLFLNVYLIFSTLLVLIFFNIPRYQIQMSFIMIPTAMYGLYNIFLKLNLIKSK